MSSCIKIILFLTVVLIFCVVKSQAKIFKETVDVLDSATIFTNDLKKYVLQNRNISEVCSSQLLQYENDLRNMKIWALKMFDASGKIPSGILNGNVMELGSFNECIDIQEKTATTEIFGKYCIAEVQIELSRNGSKSNSLNGTKSGMSLIKDSFKVSLGHCFPNACLGKDMEQLYKNIGLTLTINEQTCQTNENESTLDDGAIVVLSFLGITLWWIIVSTAYDAVILHLEKAPIHHLLTAFSVLSNGRKLFSTNKSADEISCLNGIRVISTMWVILGHSFLLQFMLPIKNYSYVTKWITSDYNMYVINATISVDTFFLISGLTISYVFMIYSKKGIKFNVLVFYFHRYIRLTPALAIMILIHIYLVKYMGSGPLWHTVNERLIATCERNWWKTLLYIQNYGDVMEICIPQSWYLSVDMQLFIFSPLLLIPLLHWSRLTLFLTSFLALCSIATCFAITWIFKLHSTLIGDNAFEYTKYYYTATYSRAAPWLIGVILGYLIYTNKKKDFNLVINKFLVLILWIIALMILCVVVFGGHHLMLETDDLLLTSFYNALIRVTWAIALGWIIFACEFNYAGIVNWFLSWKIFKILSRLSYSLYLTHYLIITVITSDMKDLPTLSNAFMLRNVWVYYALTLFASIVLTLAFESPIIAVERQLFRRTEKKIPETNLTK